MTAVERSFTGIKIQISNFPRTREKRAVEVVGGRREGEHADEGMNNAVLKDYE